MKDEKLTPRITGTAKGLYAIYMTLSLLCLLAYRATGMSWYDAYCHMATTIGLGGFSNRDAGFQAFDSPATEFVAIVFMLIAGINFATHFHAWRARSLGPYWRCPEAKYYLASMFVGALLIAALLYSRDVYDSPWTALRYALFNTISVATTTGFATTDYSAWPIFAPGADAGAVVLRHLGRLHRGRHQDDPHGHPGQAGAPRIRPHPASAGDQSRPRRRLAGAQPRGVLGAGLHPAVLGVAAGR